MQAPPVLTPERIDAMLSILAEVCLESVVEAGQRQKAAADDEAFERCGRSLQGACRNLRQTIAMKQRFDREEAQKASDARRLDAETREAAAREREAAVSRRRAQLRVRLRHDIWNEYEPEEADELCDGLDACIRDLTAEDDFLDAPFDSLLQRLADDLGLGEEPANDPPDPNPSIPAGPSHRAAGQDRETPQAPLSNRGERRDAAESAEISASSAKTSAISAVESDGSAVAGADPPTCETPAAESPPPPPPDPPPEPYIPPWEKLRPGQIMPGGSGW